jgi:hypothetical protein
MKAKQVLISIKTQISMTFDQKHRLFGPLSSPISLPNARFNALYWGGIALGLALAWLFATQQVVDGDQEQMLFNGYMGAYLGQWSSFGNTASVVGNVPGNLLGIVVGGPLLMWNSPYSPMLFLVLTRLFGFFLFDSLIKQAFTNNDGSAQVTRLTFLLLCWLNPWFLYETLLYNPSYLFFCAALHCWSAWHLRLKRSFVMTLLHVLAIGLAMQLHYSWPLLAIISLILWWQRQIKINYWAVGAALGFIALSLLPYWLALSQNANLAHNANPETQKRYIGYGAVHVFPVIKSYFYWLRYGSWWYPSKLVNDTAFIWLSSEVWLQLTAMWLWRTLIYIAGIASLLFALWANILLGVALRGQWLRRHVNKIITPAHWLGLYALAAVVATLITAGLAPITFNYWHLILVFPFALFPVLLLLRLIFKVYPHALKGAGLVVLAFFIFVNMIVANDSRKFSHHASYHQQVIDYVQKTVVPK